MGGGQTAQHAQQQLPQPPPPPERPFYAQCLGFWLPAASCSVSVALGFTAVLDLLEAPGKVRGQGAHYSSGAHHPRWPQLCCSLVHACPLLVHFESCLPTVWGSATQRLHHPPPLSKHAEPLRHCGVALGTLPSALGPHLRRPRAGGLVAAAPRQAQLPPPPADSCLLPCGLKGKPGLPFITFLPHVEA